MNTHYDSRSDTFISSNSDNLKDNPIDNKRVIWEFTLGITNDTKSKYELEIQRDNFENAVFEITNEITKITDGLTYEYCHGMWLRRNQGSLELPPLLKKNNSNNGIQHNLSVRISIIVIPKIANEIYNLVKNIISNINKKYELGLIHIQAMKTIGTAHHFVLE
jgi:hypothetical protein